MRNFPNELSEPVEILLGCDLWVIKGVISPLGPHIEYESDGQEVEVGDTDSNLNAPEHEQRSRHFPFGIAAFFLAFTSVNRLAPHRSRISGSTS